MGQHQHDHRSHLFMMRLWLEELGKGQTEWRGQVQHVLSGETRYFRDWTTMVEFILTTLPRYDGAGGASAPADTQRRRHAKEW
jgi:hypothetical protein